MATIQPRRKVTIQTLQENPGQCLESICAHVATGGTLFEFCQENQVQYLDISNWLNLVPSRRNAYDMAKQSRGEYLLETILRQLIAIVDADISQAYDAQTGDPLPMKEWPSSLKIALQSYQRVFSYSPKNGNAKVSAVFKTWDKLKGLELLGKTLGMFSDKLEVTGSVNIAHELEQAKRRIDKVVPTKEIADVSREKQ